MYGDERLSLPEPEFYVIYTGEGAVRNPKSISLSPRALFREIRPSSGRGKSASGIRI